MQVLQHKPCQIREVQYLQDVMLCSASPESSFTRPSPPNIGEFRQGGGSRSREVAPFRTDRPLGASGRPRDLVRLRRIQVPPPAAWLPPAGAGAGAFEYETPAPIFGPFADDLTSTMPPGRSISGRPAGSSSRPEAVSGLGATSGLCRMCRSAPGRPKTGRATRGPGPPENPPHLRPAGHIWRSCRFRSASRAG